MSSIALIPARASSKRIPGKALKELAGNPLIAYTIAAAKQSGIFEQIIVCTDWDECMEVARQYGVESFRRNFSHDAEPDIQWVSRMVYEGTWDAFAILRPTSPFRLPGTIQRACQWFRGANGNAEWDSLRAVQPAVSHPGKMWTLADGFGGVGNDAYCRMTPLLLQPTGTPWHSSPTQTLPKVYVQNASLEMAWTDTVRRTGTIAGDRVLAFETHGYEGFDLNTVEDWILAEALIDRGLATLPEVT